MNISSITGHSPYLGLFILSFFEVLASQFLKRHAYLMRAVNFYKSYRTGLWSRNRIFWSSNRRLPLLFHWKEVWSHDYQANNIS
jgi:hypothetical protein